MPDRFSTLFYLVHESGQHLYPVRMRNGATGHVAFRVSAGGNTKADHIELDDESEVLHHVKELGFAVRASNKDGSRKGLYALSGHSITGIVLLK